MTRVGSSSKKDTFDSRGRVFVSTDPASAAAAWHATTTGQDLTNVACPSARLCVLTTSAGSVLLATRRHHRRNSRDWSASSKRKE